MLKEFFVETPAGTLRVTESPDPEYPGIVVMLLDRVTGCEISAHVSEYIPNKNQVITQLYSYEDPDGEPCHRHAMSPPTGM